MDRNAGYQSDGGAEAALDPVLRALTSIRTAITDLSSARLWARSDTAAREGVRDGFALLASLEAAWLGLVADLDSRLDPRRGPIPDDLDFQNSYPERRSASAPALRLAGGG